ncbi:hypothetical protein DS742_24820 [Lacrimispora amygdalina]|uniref:Uncharacterized protein n=1 Tax=Lacrimispora amygdalina TaxID=253257 RepID=A0A3E2N5I0_9FIRM|nr:hypothetical protein DS742_24820 [Clostridium indicum]
MNYILNNIENIKLLQYYGQLTKDNGGEPGIGSAHGKKKKYKYQVSIKPVKRPNILYIFFLT